jgi:GT2 family glycosyltransferase
VVQGSGLRWPTHVNRYEIARPGYNMGVAASWNHIIKANMNAPWWLIGSNDVKLEHGILQQLVDSITEEPGVWRIEMGNEAKWGNHFGVFALNAAAIEKVGWFDENFYPIFWEDTEWIWRAQELNVPLHLIKSPKTHHDGNESWKGNPPLIESNKVSWDGNVKYHDAKKASGKYEWNPPSLSRLRRQQWPVEYKDSGKV